MCPFRIHALWLLAGWPYMLDYGREAVLTLSDFDVAALFKRIHGCLARERGRAGAKSKRDLFLAIHELG